jgi:hypothetical protein
MPKLLWAFGPGNSNSYESEVDGLHKYSPHDTPHSTVQWPRVSPEPTFINRIHRYNTLYLRWKMFTFVVGSLLKSLKSLFRSMSTSTMSQKAGNTDQGIAGLSPFLPLRTSQNLEIEEYMRLLFMAAVSTSEGQDQLAQHVVIKLEHMKDAGKAEHEHVVATVRDHNKNLVRLSIERSKGQKNAPQVERKESPKNYYSSSSTMALASIPSSSQDSFSKPTAAVDVVQIIGDKAFPGSLVLCIFEPQPEPIPLLRLAAIIASVHNQNTCYTPLRSQCYWFAMLVMRVAIITQGGRVKTLIEKSSKSKAGIEYEEKFLDPLMLSDPNLNQSELNQIPIHPSPSDGKSPEMVGKFGMSVGKNNGISVVVLHPEEIRIVAQEAQQRYHFELSKVSISIYRCRRSST